MSTFVPWAMQDKEGELIGFEIDVATRLAEDMGVEVEFVPTQWSGIIPALLTGRFDVIIGGMGIRPDRNLRVNFSIPYDYSGCRSPRTRATVAGGLHDARRVQLRPTHHRRPDRDDGGRRGAEVPAERRAATLRAETQAVQEVLNGSADAIVASAPLPGVPRRRQPGDAVPADVGDVHQGADRLCASQGRHRSAELLQQLDPGRRGRGWLAERKQYWFGTRDWADQG